ncbi:MAG: hypothetical protein J6W63_00495 [Treponema sp.]|nr:hypothetical protein [Treponema sp.]
MQDAYFQEVQRVGTWPEIGYSAPGTAISNKSRYESSVFYFSGAATTSWQATPKAKLNDCGDDGEFWKLTASVNGTPADVKIQNDGSATECLDLTASFLTLEKNK